MRTRDGANYGLLGVVFVLVGLIIVAAALAAAVAVVVAVAVIAKQALAQRARRRAHDPWINELAVALAESGFTETRRRTKRKLGGVALMTDIHLRRGHLDVWVNKFPNAGLARQAEFALRADAKNRAAAAAGRFMVRSEGGLLYVAQGRDGHIVDEYDVGELVQTVQAIPYYSDRAIPGDGTSPSPPGPVSYGSGPRRVDVPRSADAGGGLLHLECPGCRAINDVYDRDVPCYRCGTKLAVDEARDFAASDP